MVSVRGAKSNNNPNFLFDDWALREDATPPPPPEKGNKSLYRPAKCRSRQARCAVMEVRIAVNVPPIHPRDWWLDPRNLDRVQERIDRAPNGADDHSHNDLYGLVGDDIQLLCEIQQEEQCWLDGAAAVRLAAACEDAAKRLRAVVRKGRLERVRRVLDAVQGDLFAALEGRQE